MDLREYPNFKLDINILLQLTPGLTDFKGPTIFICYRRISVIANIENKEPLFKEHLL